jgi:hypothetical protein
MSRSALTHKSAYIHTRSAHNNIHKSAYIEARVCAAIHLRAHTYTLLIYQSTNTRRALSQHTHERINRGQIHKRAYIEARVCDSSANTSLNIQECTHRSCTRGALKNKKIKKEMSPPHGQTYSAVCVLSLSVCVYTRRSAYTRIDHTCHLLRQ